MPKQNIDYSQIVVYKIVCNDLNVKECYVGHTSNFIKRKYNHRYNCINNIKKFKVYETIRNNGGWENWSMLEIEKFSCNNKQEALLRERHWYEILNTSLNSYLPLMGENYNYYNSNKNIIKEKTKIYKENNKEYIENKRKEKIECECGKDITRYNLKRHRSVCITLKKQEQSIQQPSEDPV
jgi:hypothetical protein